MTPPAFGGSAGDWGVTKVLGKEGHKMLGEEMRDLIDIEAEKGNNENQPEGYADCRRSESVVGEINRRVGLEWTYRGDPRLVSTANSPRQSPRCAGRRRFEWQIHLR
jgi:hypothetical protein